MYWSDIYMEWLICIGILVVVFGLVWWDVENDPLLGKDRSAHRASHRDKGSDDD